MPEMHLRQPGFTYSAYEPFTKNNEKLKQQIQEKQEKQEKQKIQEIFIKTN